MIDRFSRFDRILACDGHDGFRPTVLSHASYAKKNLTKHLNAESQKSPMFCAVGMLCDRTLRA